MLFLLCFNRFLLIFERQCLHQLLLILVMHLLIFFFLDLHEIFLILDFISKFLINLFLFSYFLNLINFLDSFLEMTLLDFFVLKLDFPQVFRLTWLWSFIFSFFNLRVPFWGFLCGLFLGDLKCSLLPFLKNAFKPIGLLLLRWLALVVLVSYLISV